MANDPSSATAATRRVDCSSDAMPPLDAAHGHAIVITLASLRLVSIVSLPVNDALLLGRKMKRRGCCFGELRAREVCSSKITTSEAAMAKVCTNETRSDETNALKRTCSKIAA